MFSYLDQTYKILFAKMSETTVELDYSTKTGAQILQIITSRASIASSYVDINDTTLNV